MVDPPRRLAPDGDHQNGGGIRGTAAKTRAGPEGERSENVDPTGVEVGAAVDLAPSPAGPERVVGARFAPESDPVNEVATEKHGVASRTSRIVESIREGYRQRKGGSPIDLIGQRRRAIRSSERPRGGG